MLLGRPTGRVCGLWDQRWIAVAFMCAMSLVCVSCGKETKAGLEHQEAPHDSLEDVVEVVTKLEHEWVAAEEKRDIETVERILADDWIAITSEGSTLRKPEDLDDLRKEKYKLYSASIDSIGVRVFDDVAIATLIITEKSRYGGGDYGGRRIYTDVWTKRTDRWQVVATHGTWLSPADTTSHSPKSASTSK